MGHEGFSAAMNKRALTTVKTELEFLADNEVITQAQLTAILNQLPSEDSLSKGVGALSLGNKAPAAQSVNEKRDNNFYNTPEPTPAPPPAYGNHAPPPPAPVAPILTHAISMYAYNASDAGDLNLQPNDRVAVTEYMNAEWWKGRNERTGQEGIFPRSYVRVEEKQAMPPPPTHAPSNYGNVPVDVAQGQQPQGEKKDGFAKKVGGKLGNAAVFGAGATIGSKVVNSIF